VANSPLDLSEHAGLGPLARLLAALRQAAGLAPVLLVGAAARDVLLVHAHGVEVERATEDTDLALAVRSWEAFLSLRETLIASGGFTADGPPHRIRFGDQRLDMIPFGGLERPDRSIAWPTEGAEVMSVAGLIEALATAVAVRLPGGDSIDVAPLPALAVLKIWAWTDRRYTAPGKDASDIWMFLRHYAEAGNQDRLYGEEGMDGLAAFGFDLEAAGAWLLGKDARVVLAHGPDPGWSLESLDAILRPEVDPDGALRLVGHMPIGDRERQLSLLTAFCAGLFEMDLAKTDPDCR
jgi:predicted nucleotidyltransferase